MWGGVLWTKAEARAEEKAERKQWETRTQAVGRGKLGDVVLTGELGSYIVRRSTDPVCGSYDPVVAGQPAIPYSDILPRVTAVTVFVADA